MLAATVRSGLVESTHEWHGAAVTADGELVGAWGDVDRPFFHRSAIKPLQATASQEAGAGLDGEQLAMASASHSGHPVHVAIVRRMLDQWGLDEAALQCPPDPPLGPSARARLLGAGATPTRVHHNCSGKHVAFLRACAASGWPATTYLDPDHPLQRRVVDLVAEVSGHDPRPVGVDGCGAPTLRGTTRSLALAFARLGSDPRLAEAATACSRYPALVAGNDRGDGRFGMWWGGPAKVGAQGLMAAGRNGIGLAVKSSEGSMQIALVALLDVAARLGLLSSAALGALGAEASPVVLGAGRPVGSIVPDLSRWRE